MANDRDKAREWEQSYLRMKSRAERAEARVQELEAALKNQAAPKPERTEKLVSIAPGVWKYEEKL